jgi:hypothetical protein
MTESDPNPDISSAGQSSAFLSSNRFYAPHRSRGCGIIQAKFGVAFGKESACEFITLISVAAVWPLSTHAQQSERRQCIDGFMSLAEDDAQA